MGRESRRTGEQRRCAHRGTSVVGETDEWRHHV